MRVLGPVRVLGPAGDPVDPPRALPTRLVVALALAGRDGRGVAGLAEDVWPDREPRNPRAALQMLVSRTRTVAAPDVVESTATGYRLRDSDLLLAEQAGEEQAAEALALWTGEPAAGLDPSPIADDLVARAARARRRLLGLEADRLLRAGRAGAAVPVLEQLVAADPLDGAVVRLLMRTLRDTGSTDRAQAVFAVHREALADALGTDPAAETTALNVELLRAADAPATGARLVGVRASATPLLGRDEVDAEVAAAVGAHRLTSVIGTGGLGKTRLAQEVAALSAGRFDRVVFTELAGARSDDDVALVVGSTVGARPAQAPRRLGDPPPADLPSRTREALASGRTLLVLDNCEQVIDAAARLTAELLAAVPGLSVLATSRVPLLLPGERVVALQPLPAQGAGSRLIVERATAVRPGAVLDAQVVARVCERLDGLPLAIELAAARLRSMGLAELDRRLQDRFAVLVGGDRTAPERHRTLFAVIDWSRRLLSPQAREALALLAVFPDGFTAESADALLDRDAGDVLTELVDQSLLGFRDDRGPDGRYRMLETVREFGLRDLAETGRAEAAGLALDRWALRFVRRIGPGLLLGRDVAATRAMSAEEETLLTVLRGLPAGRAETAVAVFGLLAEHWAYRGDFEAAMDTADLVLPAAVRRPETDDQRVESLRALLFLFATSAAGRRSGTTRALALLRRALGSGTQGDGFWEVIARELLRSGATAGLDGAADRIAEARDPVIRIVGLAMRSQLLENRGEADASLALQRQIDALAVQHGLQWMRVFSRMSTVSLLAQRGAHARALEQAVALQRDERLAGSSMNLQQLEWSIGTSRLALGQLDEAHAVFTSLVSGGGDAVRGDAADLRALALAGLAEIAAARDDAAAALAAWDRALVAGRRVAWPWRVVLLGAAVAGRLRIGASPQDVAPSVRRLRGVLLAVCRIDPHQLDAPVFGAGLLGLAAALQAERPQVAARLVGLGLAMSARMESAELARVAATSDRAPLSPAEAVDAAIALLRSPDTRP